MRLADFLQHMEEILVRWEEFAGRRPSARSMSLAELRDYAEQILEAVCRDLGLPPTTEARVLKGEGRASAFAACETAAQTHAHLRAGAGFDTNAMAAEPGIACLGAWVSAGCRRSPDRYKYDIRLSRVSDIDAQVW
jgi:hypothetical protein